MTALASTVVSPAFESFQRAFESLPLVGGPVATLRSQAFQRAIEQGVPTQRDERWKYTNLKRLETRSFDLPQAPRALAVDSLDVLVPNIGPRLVIVDGIVSPALSNATASSGVSISNLDERAFELPAQGTTFEYLNAALATNGWVIEIEPGANLECLHIVHFWTSAPKRVMSHPRLSVRALAGSRFSIVEHYVGQGDGEVLTKPVTLLKLDAGARGTYVRLQQDGTRAFHIGAVRATLARDAQLSISDIGLGANIGRLDLYATLTGEGAAVQMNGLFYPDGTQHLDSHTRVEHNAPRTESDENYRGIASGRGRGVFNGMVVVAPHAQKTSARQSNRNLLLSPQAEIDTKPELEIYANDVKCSHGATTGQLDAQQLFYLRSRGLSLEDGRALLTQAFAESILNALEIEPLRAHVEQAIRAKMSAAMSISV